MNYGKNAIKVGDVLYGYYCGYGSNRKNEYHSFIVVKVGNKYFYDDLGKKYDIVFNRRYFPQSNDLIAEDYNPNHRYRYYKTREAAERARKAYRLKFKLNSFDFLKIDDYMALDIAKLLDVKQEEDYENS